MRCKGTHRNFIFILLITLVFSLFSPIISVCAGSSGESDLTQESSADSSDSATTESALESDAQSSEEVSPASWPDPGISITADAAAVIDADTLTLLYGKNRNEQYYPASITKLMTALLTLENCDLDETVTVTEEALRLDSGAVTVGLSVGDTLSVRDLLYATLLRSANDAAGALAVHVGGSIDGFATMMNERAQEIGCTHTHFTNPHGMPDNSHVTSAYDMALIMAECVKNEDFLEIESHDSYTIGGTARNPGGYTVNMGHRMLREGTGYYDERVIAGKTGYTIAAGNTLVTCATSGERTVVIALLSGRNPYNYDNTSSLIDFGLNNFTNLTLTDALTRFDSGSRLAADHIAEGSATNLEMNSDVVVTLPSGYVEGALSADYEYNMPAGAPEMAVAIMEVQYAGRTVGEAYILDDRESSLSVVQISGTVVTVQEVARRVSIVVILGAVVAIGSVLVVSELQTRRRRIEKERMRLLKRRRDRRLMDMGVYPGDIILTTGSRRPKRSVTGGRRAGNGSGSPRAMNRASKRSVLAVESIGVGSRENGSRGPIDLNLEWGSESAAYGSGINQNRGRSQLRTGDLREDPVDLSREWGIREPSQRRTGSRELAAGRNHNDLRITRKQSSDNTSHQSSENTQRYSINFRRRNTSDWGYNWRR